MVTRYADMTLGQMLQLQGLKDIKAGDAVKEMMFVSILTGLPTSELRKMDGEAYARLREQLKFLAVGKPDDMQPTSEVTINGREYVITDEACKIIAGQYIDFMTYSQDNAGIIDLLSCLIIPKGHEYADGYDMDKVKEDIADLPLPVANYISFFWRASLNVYARRMVRQMRREIRKLPKAQRAMMRPLQTELKSLLCSGGDIWRRYIADLATHRRPRKG